MLTTNDVRVLRTLKEDGPQFAASWPPEMRRRVNGLAGAELVQARGRLSPSLLDVTADGVRALHATDRAAYGRFA